MATKLQTSTPRAITDSTYGFFKSFPRELRDAVYDLLDQGTTVNVKGLDSLDIHMRTVLVEPRLISRQFRLEYDERSAANEQNNHLTVRDTPNFQLFEWEDGKPPGIELRCPAFATRAISLTLNLIACMGTMDNDQGCNADFNIEWHITWIECLLQSLPHLRKIRVRLYLASTSCISEVLKQAKLFTALPYLVDVTIAGSTSMELVGSADDSVLLATWTKQQGLQEDHEAIELYRKRHADVVAVA